MRDIGNILYNKVKCLTNVTTEIVTPQQYLDGKGEQKYYMLFSTSNYTYHLHLSVNFKSCNILFSVGKHMQKWRAIAVFEHPVSRRLMRWSTSTFILGWPAILVWDAIKKLKENLKFNGWHRQRRIDLVSRSRNNLRWRWHHACIRALVSQ